MPLPLTVAATAAAVGWTIWHLDRDAKYRRGLFPSVPESWWQTQNQQPVFMVKAALYRRLRLHAKYRELLEQFVAQYPSLGYGHYALSFYLLWKGEAAAALNAAREHLRVEPDSPVAHYQLGQCLEQLGDHRPARTHYRRFLELEPASSLVATVESALQRIDNTLKNSRASSRSRPRTSRRGKSESHNRT